MHIESRPYPFPQTESLLSKIDFFPRRAQNLELTPSLKVRPVHIYEFSLTLKEARLFVSVKNWTDVRERV